MATTPFQWLSNQSSEYNMSADPVTNVGFQCTFQPIHQIWSPTLLAVFSVFGIVGNGLLLVVILINPSLRTSPNMMMLNLTLGDLIYLLISAPIHIEHEIHPCWQFGNIGCKVINTLQNIGISVCVLSLTAVSGERYMAITRKVRVGRGKAKCQTAIIVTLIWTLAVVFSLPLAFMAEVKFDVICMPLPFDHINSKIYVMCYFIMMYLFPLTLISTCYIKMASALVRSTQSFSGESQTAGGHQFIMRRRLAFIILTISVFFAVFWFPYHVYNIWFQFSFDPDAQNAATHFFRQFHFFMAFSNSCFNPWIVFLMSSKHRNGIMKCCRKEEQGFKSFGLQSVSRGARSSGNWTDQANTEMSAMKNDDGNTAHGNTHTQKNISG